MKRTPLAEMGISELLPPDLRVALIACDSWPAATRIDRIDQLTDEAARRGLARHRTCTALLARWQANRPQFQAAPNDDHTDTPTNHQGSAA